MYDVSIMFEQKNYGYRLERIRLCLPLSSNLDTNLDTLIDIFRAALIINTELEHVPVLEFVRPALCVRRAQPNMVQERPR
jgi:hypothetical protein